jgi:hypothetical protein
VAFLGEPLSGGFPFAAKGPFSSFMKDKIEKALFEHVALNLGRSAKKNI